MLETHYTTVKDCFLINWINLYDGDSKALRVGKKGTPKTDNKAYELLMEDYLKTFGLDPINQVLVDKRRELALMLNEYFEDVRKNRRMLTFIEMLEHEVRELENGGGNGQKPAEVVAELRKQGIVVDVRTWTVYEYEHQVRRVKDGK